MTGQQYIGIASAIVGGVSTSLLAAQTGGADIPAALTITLAATSAGLGAAVAYLGTPGQMLKSSVRKVGRAKARLLVDITTKAPQ